MQKVVSKLTRFFSSQSEFEKDFTFLGKDLGKGAYAVVRLAKDNSSKEDVAIKCVIKKKMTPDDEAALKIEVQILQEVIHYGVIKLLAYYEEPKHHYLVLELMSGGELFTKIVQKEVYSEADAQKVVKTIADVLDYCHSQGIVHRDLKPENVLLKDRTDSAQIKIADFGFARHVDQGCKTACGTPGYVAPEIISGKIYGAECDNWSLGVLMFILLCGYPPFFAKNRHDLFKSIRHARYTFDSPYWDGISPEAKGLIKKMLIVDPKARITAKDILQDPWITGTSTVTPIDSANVKNLQLFNARRHFKAGVVAAVAAGKMQDILAAMKKE